MLRSILFLLVVVFASMAAAAEEIPLEHCDRLLVAEASISGMKFLFLVDTAATSMLNLKSFAHGDPRKVNVTSWNGTVEANAQQVVVADLAIGQHHFKNIRLPAVDLSAIGRACGRQVDGILGIDLLGKLGAMVDLKGQTARLLVGPDDGQARIAELHAQLVACEQAFNRGDEKAFADCLDQQAVIYTVAGEYYGREAAMQYYGERYFRQNPPAQLSIIPRAHHLLGEAIWVEYDLRVAVHDQVIQARGTALCQKEDGKWRIVHMNHSSRPPEASSANGREAQPSKAAATGP